jgi:bifunctional DNA-binding transcriptional regulator/antitoxin component of YhaV-PrlF toxin-antitoxin module
MTEKKKMLDTVPQLVSITSVTAEGILTLRKAVRQYIGVDDKRKLYLEKKTGEIILSAGAGKGKPIEIDSKNRICLPSEVLNILGAKSKTQVALVERNNAVAIKAFKVTEEQGERAGVADIETDHNIVRKVQTNPEPEQFLPMLVERYRDVKLRYDLRAFLKGRKNLQAWQARRAIGSMEKSDKQLKQRLIEDRLNIQHENGSWENHVPVTARNLSELADLGMTRKNSKIQKAIDWLIDRPQSKYNPGIWFATDELIREQAQVIKRRKQHKDKGPRERFNQRKAEEVNLICAGEPLAFKPCGPRISWPTALVLEALLKLGCENLERVQIALQTLAINPIWCDNSYQHGLSEWKRTKPPPKEALDMFIKYSIRSFKYGGVCDLQELSRADMCHQPFHMRRVAQFSSGNSREYPLKMPSADLGCRIMMIRALSNVKNRILKKITEIYLWNYAGLQNNKDGSFNANPERTFTDLQLVLLQIFARYNHPVARLVILRALSWIINNQNRDGSWGKEPYKDVATLAVARSFVRLGDYLPANFIANE